MEKDPISKMLDDSFDIFEAKAFVPKIMGYDYPTYCSIMMFVDAFADAAVNDSPTVAEKFQIPGRDMLENVLDYFDSLKLDILDFVDQSTGLDFLDNLAELWGDHFSVDGLMTYDKNALGTIVLMAVGHDIKLDRDIKELLKDHDAKEPTIQNLGMDHDERRYKSAYEALGEIANLQNESRDNLSESFLSLFGIQDAPKKKGKTEADALKLIESILKQLKIKYHVEKEKGDEGIVFRHSLIIDKKHYVLKTYVILESGHISSVLWDKNETNFFVVVSLGYLKDYYALVAFGKQRLKAWMEKNHGRRED
jgi:hypothetical protein